MKNKIKYIIILLFLIGLSYYFYNSKEYIVFELVGQKDVELEINQKYSEAGFRALKCKLFFCVDISDYVLINGSVYNSFLGEYTIKYILDYNENKKEIIRNIRIIETVAPKISLNGDSTEYVLLNSAYQEKNAIAIDNKDGDISKNIVVSGYVDTTSPGEYIIQYKVTDSDFNTSMVERKVKVIEPIVESVDDFDAYFTNYIKEKKYSVSVGYYNLDNGYTYKYNANKVYYGASLIKTLVALYAYEKLPLTTDIKDKVGSTVMVSNNKSFVNMMSKIGFDNLRNYGKSLGAKYVLNYGNNEYCGSTIVDDQLIYWKYLWNFINNNPNGEELKSYFINTKSNYIKFNDDLVVMHKYGAWDSYFHDVGIVLDSSPYIVVILTTEGNKNFQEVIENISKVIYDFNILVKLKK